MRQAHGCGLAAPQLGHGVQLLMFEVTDEMLASEAAVRDLNALGMQLRPLTILANPELRVLGRHTTTHREGWVFLNVARGEKNAWFVHWRISGAYHSRGTVRTSNERFRLKFVRMI